MVVRNKIDLSGDAPGLRHGDGQVINISASAGAGIDQLRAEIRTLAGYKDQGEGAFTARRRHVEALLDAGKHFELGRDALLVDKAGELMAEELRLAQHSLGEITGTLTSDDLLGKIFSEFCIGK
jgi:tRNA modification GTPase